MIYFFFGFVAGIVITAGLMYLVGRVDEALHDTDI